MKLLLDSCMWGKTTVALRDAGYDVEWAGDWPSDPGMRQILSQAFSEGRILITLDKDFGELAIRENRLHHGILRIVNFQARQQANVCLTVLPIHGEELFAGAIITAEPGRLRIRSGESPGGEIQQARPDL